MMKTYELTLKLKSGLLTELQSDTIYGHFCWRLKEKLGEGKLSEFISAYKNWTPVFTVSDGLLKVYDEIHFPRPLIFNRPDIMKTKSEKILEFVNRKANKERNYLTLSEFKYFLLTGKVEIMDKTDAEIKDRKKKKRKTITTEALRVSVQIDRNTFGTSEGNLFSYSSKYTGEDVLYSVFIKVLDDKAYKYFDCENIIKEVFTVGFGKKKSSGYGQFEVRELIESNDLVEPEDTNAFMILGNYLPSESESVFPVGYDINTKYGKLGEELSQSENPFKNPISFLTAGSCFKTKIKKDFYGRVTDDGEISAVNSFVVQFAMPFTINFKLEE